MKKTNSLLYSFNSALTGIKTAFTKERNIKIHAIATITIILISILFQISKLEFIIILLCISLVISLELINTAIEELSNLYSTKYNLNIKSIKDIAAGRVLIASVSSFLIGCIIFIPKCLKDIELWK